MARALALKVLATVDGDRDICTVTVSAGDMETCAEALEVSEYTIEHTNPVHTIWPDMLLSLEEAGWTNVHLLAYIWK